MKKHEITIGDIYSAKVSGKIVDVRIEREYLGYTNRTGWLARNLTTNREITIRSAARLRPRSAVTA